MQQVVQRDAKVAPELSQFVDQLAPPVLPVKPPTSLPVRDPVQQEQTTDALEVVDKVAWVVLGPVLRPRLYLVLLAFSTLRCHVGLLKLPKGVRSQRQNLVVLPRPDQRKMDVAVVPLIHDPRSPEMLNAPRRGPPVHQHFSTVVDKQPHPPLWGKRNHSQVPRQHFRVHPSHQLPQSGSLHRHLP